MILRLRWQIYVLDPLSGRLHWYLYWCVLVIITGQNDLIYGTLNLNIGFVSSAFNYSHLNSLKMFYFMIFFSYTWLKQGFSVFYKTWIYPTGKDVIETRNINNRLISWKCLKLTKRHQSRVSWHRCAVFIVIYMFYLFSLYLYLTIINNILNSDT